MSYYSLSFAPGVEHSPRPVSIVRVDLDEPAPPRKAVDLLRSGGVIAFPTAEGYLVGCDATNEIAVRRLCELTGTPPADVRYLAATPEQAARLAAPARVISDPIPLGLMRAADVPLAASTCRPAGSPAPSAQHVVFVLGDSLDLVLDAGPVGKPPAVVR